MKKPLLPLLLFLALCTAAKGAINITFLGTPGSSVVQYSLSGSGSFAPFATISPTGFGLNDLSFDAFGSALDDNLFGTAYPAVGSGTLTNTTTGHNTSLLNFSLNDDGGAGLDDILLRFEVPLTMSPGDNYTIFGNGVIDLSLVGASFDDMNVGTGTFATPGIIDAASVTIGIAPIPEPSRVVFACLGVAAMLLRRRRG